MIHKYFLTTLFCLSAYCLSAQGPLWNWETNCGSSSSDKALDVAIGSDGSVYTCGYFNDNGQFGPNIYLNNNSYSKDAFLAKQDQNGNYIWVNYLNSGLDDRALGLCIDKDDNIIITGTFWTSMTVGPYQLNGSADSPFIVKYSDSGALIWAITGGGDGDDHGFDMVTDIAGDIYLTGFLSTHYGPPTCTAFFGNLPSFTYSDSIAFLTKISAAGIFQWVRTFDGADVERDNDIAIDNQGGIYVVGGFYGTNKVFGPITMSSNSGSRDIFVVKYDSNGNFQFVNQVGGYNDDRANGITCGADNMLYITGEFRAEIYFDGDTLNNNGGGGGKDIFVAKMDINGGWKWASKAGSDGGGECGRAITSTSQHCIFVTGQCKGANVAFGDSLSLNTGTDSIQIFVAGIDTAGKWRWAIQCGGVGEDRGYGIDADNSCRLYFCGYFSAPTCTFGPYIDSTYGLKDGFVSRLDVTCFDYVSDTLSGIADPHAAGCAPVVNSLLMPGGNANVSTIRVTGGECLADAQWTIYSVLGSVVYQSDDIYSQWDGRDQSGHLLPAGAYFYEIRGNDGTGVQSFTGRVQLIR